MPGTLIGRALIALAMTLLVGCGGGQPTPATSDPARASGTKAADPSPPAASVPEILMFEEPLLGGSTLDGTSLAGKDVAFWFWAPW